MQKEKEGVNMPEESKDYLNLEEPSRDIVIGYLTSYISCLEGILEDREEQLKNAEYNIKKAIGMMPYVLDEQKTKLLEEEISSIKSTIGFTKGEIASVQDTIQTLRTLTYCVIRPATISQAKREIAQKTGAPENIIEVEIDHATPVYTQYSLGNRLEVYEKAKHKDKVTDYYRFQSRTFEE